jgi:hypothetical protein
MLTHIGAKIRYEEWRPFLHIAAPERGWPRRVGRIRPEAQIRQRAGGRATGGER